MAGLRRLIAIARELANQFKAQFARIVRSRAGATAEGYIGLAAKAEAETETETEGDSDSDSDRDSILRH